MPQGGSFFPLSGNSDLSGNSGNFFSLSRIAQIAQIVYFQLIFSIFQAQRHLLDLFFDRKSKENEIILIILISFSQNNTREIEKSPSPPRGKNLRHLLELFFDRKTKENEIILIILISFSQNNIRAREKSPSSPRGQSSPRGINLQSAREKSPRVPGFREKTVILQSEIPQR